MNSLRPIVGLVVRCHVSVSVRRSLSGHSTRQRRDASSSSWGVGGGMSSVIGRLGGRGSNPSTLGGVGGVTADSCSTSTILGHETAAAPMKVRDDAAAKLRDVRAILFDANGVLYVKRLRGPSKIDALRMWLLSYDYTRPYNERKGPLEYPISSAETLERLNTLKADISVGKGSIEDFYGAILDHHDVRNDATRQRALEYLRTIDSEVELYPTVRHTLSSLRAHGFQLGVITNSMATQAEKLRWLSNAGLLFRWDTFISSAEVGAKKPDAPIYLVRPLVERDIVCETHSLTRSLTHQYRLQ